MTITKIEECILELECEIERIKDILKNHNVDSEYRHLANGVIEGIQYSIKVIDRCNYD